MPDVNRSKHARQILDHVVARLAPNALVAEAISLTERGVSVHGHDHEIPSQGRLVILAVGKASVPMAAGALDEVGQRVSTALAVTKSGLPLSVEPPASLEVLESDHPVPAESSLNAGRQILSIADSLTENDLVLMLISGGGSALIEELVDGVTLADLRKTTEHLLQAGASINELNAIRRRLSRIKGGRLAQAIAPARIVNLIISDVLGNPLQDIASGPTVAPPGKDETFTAVMNRPDLIDGLPSSVRHHLDADRKSGVRWADNVAETRILADASTAALAAIEAAEDLGYRIQSLGFDFQGEAREFGRTFATIARHAAGQPEAFGQPVVLIGSGELTVTVQGGGVGGRNTEMALSAAIDVSGTSDITIASFATDGDDGLSQCAGGLVDGKTAQRLRDAGTDPVAALRSNDSATALRTIDATIDIGPTGTNVNDIYLAFVGSRPSRRPGDVVEDSLPPDALPTPESDPSPDSE